MTLNPTLAALLVVGVLYAAPAAADTYQIDKPAIGDDDAETYYYDADADQWWQDTNGKEGLQEAGSIWPAACPAHWVGVEHGSGVTLECHVSPDTPIDATDICGGGIVDAPGVICQPPTVEDLHATACDLHGAIDTVCSADVRI